MDRQQRRPHRLMRQRQQSDQRIRSQVSPGLSVTSEAEKRACFGEDRAPVGTGNTRPSNDPVAAAGTRTERNQKTATFCFIFYADL